ncbi:exodeoxyribonuclease VII large subunit, partial [Luteimonas sp. SJ-92]
MTDAATGEILTPSQLNTLARSLLEDAFPLVLVEGELGNVSRPASGHLYFTLKDARAQVRCAMFRPKSQWLRFQPREGLKVLARGRLTLYEARGDYQLILDSLEEAGEGALRRAFEALKAKLQAEGLFDASRKRPLPPYVRRLGVVTSPSGAAVRDVLSVLARRFPLLEVEILPVPVQGEGAAAQIVAMLRRAAACGRYDALLLTRGGGSLEDLQAFNDEALARAVAASPVPVVAAVGHETDFSLAEFAADLRAPTPSAAAELLVPDSGELLARLRTLQRRVAALGLHRLQQAAQRTDRAALRLQALRP